MKQIKYISEKVYIDLYQSLGNFLSDISLLIEKYGEDAILDFTYEEDMGVEMYINTSREETDEEYQRRLSKEEESKEIRKKQYLQLKKEFEND